jgi:hypothetical protein
MPRSTSPSGYYYYASGQPVDLTLDADWLAIDTRMFKAAATSPRLQAALRKDARPLRGDLILVQRKAIPAKQLDALTLHGAVHPVFRADGAMMIALPEVRVEESSTQRQRAVHRWVRQHGDLAELVADNGTQILLRPTSGHGIDAITLANHLTEQIGPEMAQARFLRVVEHFAGPSSSR